MKNKLRDAIYGLAVGDALGVPYEFKKRGTFKCTDMVGYGTHNQPAGTWSDDTSLTLATCCSIKQDRRMWLGGMMNRFRNWYYDEEFTAHGEVFDVGRTTAMAIHRGYGFNDIRSNGNGSLMRIIPLAFVKDITSEEVAKVSSLTHAHSISTAACLLYVTIATGLIYEQNIKDMLKKLKTAPEPYNRLHNIYELPEEEIRSTGYVVDTLEAALWCVATTDNYKDCVLKAVNLGEDTDTVAAVAGGLAGIIYGYDAIPKEWIDALANKELIERCLF